MVLELLVQFEWPIVRRLLNRIFMVGENTRIWGFRERFCKDLKTGLDGIASLLGRDVNRTQRWSVNCVHAEVKEGPTVAYASILEKMDYVFRGPDFFWPEWFTSTNEYPYFMWQECALDNSVCLPSSCLTEQHILHAEWIQVLVINVLFVVTNYCILVPLNELSFHISCVESQKGAINIQRCSVETWKPDSRYHCTKSMAIAPFWFSMEHLWSAIAPFWLSANDMHLFAPH